MKFKSPYYGWIICAATATIFTITYGLRYAQGVFLVPIRDDLQWSTTATAAALSTFYWVAGSSYLSAGKLMQKFGVRKVMLLAGILFGAGAILCSTIQTPWQFYLYWGVIAAFGSGLLYIVPNIVLTRFFRQHRGKAVGWGSIGINLGTIFFVPLVGWGILHYGWRAVYAGFGALLLITVPLIGYFIFRESPESMELKVNGSGTNAQTTSATLYKTIKTRRFLFPMLSYTLVSCSLVGFLTFTVPHILELGITPVVAASMFGIIGIAGAVGSFGWGFVSDGIGRRKTIFILSGGLAISLVFEGLAPANIVMLCALIALNGLLYGGLPEQYVAFLADTFGTREGSLFGCFMFAGSVGGGVGPLIGGIFADLTGEYVATLTYLGICAGIGTALMAFYPLRSKNA